MKHISLSFLIFILLNTFIQAQSNAILFTENGERFYAVLNGLRQNDKPQTNVKITGLNATFYKLRVIFEDKKIAEKNFNMAIEENMETTIIIKKNPKGEYVLRPQSVVPIAEAPPSKGGQNVVIYDPNAAPYTGTYSQTTTTVTNGNPDGANVDVNVNTDGTNINMNISGGTTNSTSTTTTTTTTTHGNNNYENNPPPSYLPGYTGNIGCPVPVNGGQFNDMKKSIEAKSFEESKFTVAKQIVNNNCLLSSQVKQIILLFSFEQTRLDFAKYCYGYTYDIGNYYKINDAFSFESSIDDLNQYIGSFQR